MRSRIEVKLTGGLGNQLFKSMAGYQLALRHSSELVLDTTWYSYPRSVADLVSPRKIEIDYFDQLKVKWSTSRLPARVHMHSGQLFRRFPASLRTRFGYITDGDIEELDISKSKVRSLDGSFENLELLPSSEILRQVLQFPQTKSPWLVKMLNRVLVENPIAIHVRMGDYLNLPEIYGVLKPSYYLDSLEAIGAGAQSTIWLFSDEPLKAKEWLKSLPHEVQVIDVPDSVRVAEVLRLMSNCRSLVTAHSTFSWWAGLLGTIFGTNQEVVMPSRFLANQTTNDCKLIVPNWKVLPV